MGKDHVQTNQKIISINELGIEASELIRQLREEHDVIYTMQQEHLIAVMISCDAYENLPAQSQHADWPLDYFAQTYGVLIDDPLSRPAQGNFEEREIVE